MIKNYKIQNEVNTYARHHRIKMQKKAALMAQREMNKKSNTRELDEEDDKPIVIYDSDANQNTS